MIGRRAVIGLSLLSSILLSAFAAQSAFAAEETSKNTTAFTCEKVGPGNEFADAHCDNKTGGEFAHKLIPLNTTTELEGSNTSVTESTKKSEPAVLKGTIGLAKVTIECAKVKNNTAKSLVHNVEPVAGQHTFTGTAQNEFSECNVKELAKCIVAEPITSNANIHAVEGMEGPKAEKNAMGIEFIGSGAEETFAEVEFKNKGAEACSLNAKKFPIKGKVVATSGPTTESAQNNKHSGATLVFTPKFKMQTLKLGPNEATFETIGTATMAGAGGNPISLTTTT
jgi:hypothetical protein